MARNALLVCDRNKFNVTELNQKTGHESSEFWSDFRSQPLNDGTMKGKRYSQEQKVYALKQVEAGRQGGGSVPPTRGECRDVLSMKTDARIDGNQ